LLSIVMKTYHLMNFLSPAILRSALVNTHFPLTKRKKIRNLLFLFLSIYFQSFAQNAPKTYKDLIYKLDGEPFKNENIRSQLIKLSPTDKINNYFDQIKDTLIKERLIEDNLSKEAFSNYCIKNITQTATSSALEAYDERGVLQKVIAINVDYYYPKVSQRLQKAMFIWIIGHELKHLQLGGSTEDNQLELISRELLCDEMAGYVVGRLTEDITLQDLCSILNAILSDIGDSTFSAKLKYRLYAAQAGWLRGKAKNLTENKSINLYNLIFKKVGDGTSRDLIVTAIKNGEDSGLVYKRSTNGSLYWGVSNVTGDLNGDGINLVAGNDELTYSCLFVGNYKDGIRDGFFRAIWETEEYEGFYVKNAKEGYGKNIWYAGEKRGQKYLGYFKDDVRNGFGVYSDINDGQEITYIGEWKNGIKNGIGVLYRGDKVIDSGYWSNDAHIKDTFDK